MESEFERSGFKITTRKNYILIKPSKGIDFFEVLFGVSKLISATKFHHRNHVWVFRKGKMTIAYTDLYKIKEYVRNNFPKCTKQIKTAIVAETGMQRSLAELYAKIEEDLPHEIRVFPDLRLAEEWLTG